MTYLRNRASPRPQKQRTNRDLIVTSRAVARMHRYSFSILESAGNEKFMRSISTFARFVLASKGSSSDQSFALGITILRQHRGIKTWRKLTRLTS